MIVCEGDKTEPFYLRSLLRELRLTAAEVVVFGKECGSSPNTLVEFALARFDASPAYEAVYCVFDRDSHPDYNKACGRCAQLKRKSEEGKPCRFAAITSNPCFEYWALLHYIESDAPIVGKGKKSSGQVAVSLLKRHIGAYGKNMGNLYEVLRSRLPDAVLRAVRINRRNLDNPHTKMVELLSALAKVRPSSHAPTFDDVRAALQRDKD